MAYIISLDIVIVFEDCYRSSPVWHFPDTPLFCPSCFQANASIWALLTEGLLYYCLGNTAVTETLQDSDRIQG